MISRDKILVAMPVYNSLIDAGCVSGLLSCAPFYERPYIFSGNSSIALARNEITHMFVEKMPNYEWLMWIDADTRFTPRDWQLLWEGDDKLIVCAEYARKFLGMSPVQFGLGFTRVHRSVYEKIKALTLDGEDRVRRFYHKGEMMVDYHPNGALGEGRWIGEDQGFFMWAAACEIPTRLETRTRLVHAGSFGYEYPQQISNDTLSHYLQQQSPEIIEDLLNKFSVEGAQ